MLPVGAPAEDIGALRLQLRLVDHVEPVAFAVRGASGRHAQVAAGHEQR